MQDFSRTKGHSWCIFRVLNREVAVYVWRGKKMVKVWWWFCYAQENNICTKSASFGQTASGDHSAASQSKNKTCKEPYECSCSSRVVREHKRATKRTSSLVRSFAKRKQGYDTPISGNRPGPLRQSKPPSDICPSRISGQIFRLLWQSPYYNSKRQFVRIFPCQICFICSQYSKGHVHGHQQIRGP